MTSPVDFDNPGKTVLKPVKLAHIVLRTNDFLRLSSYYQIFLQAQINFENDFMHLLTYDDEHHRIGIVNMDIANKNPKPAVSNTSPSPTHPSPTLLFHICNVKKMALSRFGA
ncbi:hypothetical protein F53441_12498 [Fusarium austroafricanum]|uniref:Glyoxalase/fosfomycin resistance/dioxygenase domain-containing protein n=1 Tax=Fusarium austroafricanum TaxID=2364996 RepID=A0A8H4JYZ9_9HYPO|nr:hypothetical protein F53441_12498 [Fusarium austroafricanum]